MTITPEQRNEAYETAGDRVKFLYASSESGAFYFRTFKSNNLNEEHHYKTYIQAVGDVILGFYKPEELPALLKEGLNIDATKAKAISDQILEFITPNNAVETTADAPPVADPKPSERKIEIKNNTNQLNKIRTMEDDGKTVTDSKSGVNPPPPENLHTSTQADILPNKL